MGSTPILASIRLGGEMVYTRDLKSCGRKTVRVRAPPQAPRFNPQLYGKYSCKHFENSERIFLDVYCNVCRSWISN